MGHLAIASACLALSAIGSAQAQPPDQGTDWHGLQQPGSQQSEPQQPKGVENRGRQEEQEPQSRGRTEDRRRGSSGEDWVFVTFDLDGDGRFDGYDYLYFSDFDAARRSSSSRQGERDRSNARRQAAGRQYRVEGILTDLKSIKLVSQEKPHQMAKLNTERGKIKVDLGPANELTKLGLKEGDQISVFGSEGRINSRRILMASRVEGNGKSVAIERPVMTERLRSVAGRVVTTRTATPADSTLDHQLARLRTENGGWVLVDLGPKNFLQSIDVNNGDKLSVLGTPGSIEGEQVILAQRFELNGDVHQVRTRSTSKEEETTDNNTIDVGVEKGSAGTP
jgi:hypothetical protein